MYTWIPTLAYEGSTKKCRFETSSFWLNFWETNIWNDVKVSSLKWETLFGFYVSNQFMFLEIITALSTISCIHQLLIFLPISNWSKTVKKKYHIKQYLNNNPSKGHSLIYFYFILYYYRSHGNKVKGSIINNLTVGK